MRITAADLKATPHDRTQAYVTRPWDTKKSDIIMLCFCLRLCFPRNHSAGSGWPQAFDLFLEQNFESFEPVGLARGLIPANSLDPWEAHGDT